jgi:hypothetical protein
VEEILIHEVKKIFISWDTIGNIPEDKLENEYVFYARELVSMLSLSGVSKDPIVEYIRIISDDIVGIDPQKNSKLKSEINSVSEQIWKLYIIKKSD